MISHRKTLLRRTEFVAAAFALIALPLAFAVRQGHVAPARVEPWLVVILGAMAWICAIWLGLCRELVALRHGGDPTEAEPAPLALADVLFMQRWCPAWIKGAYALATIVFLYVFAVGGPVRWSSSEPFTTWDAIGFLLIPTIVAMMTWPAIASASRMPGSYAQCLPAHGTDADAAPPDTA